MSERLGHATAAFTIETYQHVMPGMQADAARVFEDLLGASTQPDLSTGARFYRLRPVEAPGEDRVNTVEALASNTLTRTSGGGGNE